MRFIILLYLSIIIFNDAFSQSTYLPAIIVNEHGDSVKGVIHYPSDGLFHSSVFFKAKSEEQFHDYLPSGVRHILVNNRLYTSAIVDLENSSTETPDLNKNPGFELSSDTVFLLQLVKGEKRLYFYETSTGKKNWYIYNNGKFELLLYKKYMRKATNGLWGVAENKRFIGQLSLYFNDCPDLKKRIEKVKYSELSLIDLFNSYYECIQGESDFLTDEGKLTLKTGIKAGIALTQMEYYSSGFKFNKNIGFTGGLTLDAILPRTHNKLTFANDLLFAPVYTISNKRVSDNKYVELKLNYIKLNNMLNYNLPLKKIHIFFYAGISNNLLLNNDPTSLESTYLPFYQKMYLLGTGIKYNHLTVEIRAEFGKRKDRHIYSKTSENSLLIGYKF